MSGVVQSQALTAARNHFGCDSLDLVELEDQVSRMLLIFFISKKTNLIHINLYLKKNGIQSKGTASSHWEKRIFQV